MSAPEEHVRVSLALRFDPQHLKEYFERLRSPQAFIEYFERVTGAEADQWTRELLQELWFALAPALTTLFEVYPIVTKEAFMHSFVSEVNIVLSNLMSLLRSRANECLELYRSLPEMKKSGELPAEVRNRVTKCIKLAENAPKIAQIAVLYIFEFVHRKMQFSLPVGAMPNTAKGVVGIMTD
jgi:hypothetical protein